MYIVKRDESLYDTASERCNRALVLQPKLTQAVKKALRIGAHSRDAVAQFLIPRASWFPLIFLMDGREHLCAVKVEKPDISAYGCLLCEGGAP